VAVIAVAAVTRPAAAGDGDWSFRVTPYAWFSGISGKVATLPPLPPADIDMSFGDVLDNLDGAFFISGEVDKDRFVLVADLIYADLEADDDYSGLLFNGVRLRQKNIVPSVFAGFRVVDEPKHTVDAVGGLRYWSIESDLTLTSNVVAERRIDSDESWVDPLVGLRWIVRLNENWSIASAATIGGVISGADLEWDLLATVRWQMADWASLVAGYRHLSVDYEKDGYVYDVDQTGPVLGVTFTF
jgi:hypothetical protein